MANKINGSLEAPANATEASMLIGQRLGALLETMTQAMQARQMMQATMQGKKVDGAINGVVRELKPHECEHIAMELEAKAGMMHTELVAEVAADMLGLLQEGGYRVVRRGPRFVFEQRAAKRSKQRGRPS